MIAIALTLAAMALGGGLIAGAWAGIRPESDLGVTKSFLIWLGLVAVVSTTFAQSMEALPFTLILATVLGFIPFWSGYIALKDLVKRVRAKATRDYLNKGESDT